MNEPLLIDLIRMSSRGKAYQELENPDGDERESIQ